MKKKTQQTLVTENSSIPFFYTANSGRVFYRFILNVNIPVETSQQKQPFFITCIQTEEKFRTNKQTKSKKRPQTSCSEMLLSAVCSKPVQAPVDKATFCPWMKASDEICVSNELKIQHIWGSDITNHLQGNVLNFLHVSLSIIKMLPHKGNLNEEQISEMSRNKLAMSVLVCTRVQVCS